MLKPKNAVELINSNKNKLNTKIILIYNGGIRFKIFFPDSRQVVSSCLRTLDLHAKLKHQLKLKTKNLDISLFLSLFSLFYFSIPKCLPLIGRKSTTYLQKLLLTEKLPMYRSDRLRHHVNCTLLPILTLVLIFILGKSVENSPV